MSATNQLTHNSPRGLTVYAIYVDAGFLDFFSSACRLDDENLLVYGHNRIQERASKWKVLFTREFVRFPLIDKAVLIY